MVVPGTTICAGTETIGNDNIIKHDGDDHIIPFSICPGSLGQVNLVK